MKSLIYIALMICSLALAQTQEALPNKALDTLYEHCRFKLSEELTHSIKEARQNFNENSNSVSIELTISTHPRARDINAKLNFGCHLSSQKQESESSNENVTMNTAKEEIIAEDAGGRYGRNVSWEKPFVGENWKGTVAYVNSTSGDGQTMIIPDFFLICPNIKNSTCFSIEIERGSPLDSTETGFLLGLLKGTTFSQNDKVTTDQMP